MNWKNCWRVGFLLFVVVIVGSVSVSCEGERTPAELIEALEGDWKVEENSSRYPESTYYVTISISGQDSSRIYISNFYELEGEVAANVEGQNINLIEDQDIIMNITTYTILSGRGRITDDYRQIDWSYQVDDGSGEIDEVEAVYTKQ
ncbi:MAG: hypothetical protein K9H65_00885 [Bacteroidales bacterium]|nr:hypothetical protein [Bacteroidales bacterium]